VPPIRQLNPHVPAELEQVLARALARDPAQRYQSARELGQDLNGMLFHAGQPVSSFDIAALLDPIVRSRDESKRREQKKSIIGSLIEEALFEFTSLQGGESGDRNSTEMGAAPLNIGSFDTDWAATIGLDSGPAPASEPAQASYDFGNLAALEEDTLSGRRQAPSARPSTPAPPVISAPQSAPVPSQPRALQPSAPASVAPPAPAPAPKSGKGGLIAFIVLLLIVAGAVGAYYAGVIPPQLIDKLKR
jgi:serine/threonine-protein kinase